MDMLLEEVIGNRCENPDLRFNPYSDGYASGRKNRGDHHSERTGVSILILMDMLLEVSNSFRLSRSDAKSMFQSLF